MKTQDAVTTHVRDQIADLLNRLNDVLGYLDDPPCDEREFVRRVQERSAVKSDIAECTANVQAAFAELREMPRGECLAMIAKLLEPN